MTVWFDPNLLLSEDEQLAALTSNFDDLGDMAFDYMRFRVYNNAAFYDEFRMATSWNDLVGHSSSAGVPEPATWVMLLLGAAAVGVMRWRRARV